MTTVQAMILGAVLAWGPSFIVFIYIMRDMRNAPSEDLD